MKKRGILLFLLSLTIIVQLSCKIMSDNNAGSSAVYYLVSENVPNHNDSYILPLFKPEDISLADKIVNGTESGKIIVAEIGRGSGDGVYLNKDLKGLNNKIWSWHIIKFENFADVTAEIYDGWPGYVEEHLDDWLNSKDGIIGFWNYTVKRKVDLSELQ